MSDYVITTDSQFRCSSGIYKGEQSDDHPSVLCVRGYGLR